MMLDARIRGHHTLVHIQRLSLFYILNHRYFFVVTGPLLYRLATGPLLYRFATGPLLYCLATGPNIGGGVR